MEARPQVALSEAGVARAYKRLAPMYDVLFGRVLEPGRRRMAEVVRALQPASLLEIGVGTGLALAHYPPTSKIVGIDLSHEMLERARERARALPDRQITIEHMNAERTSFADGTFDCVTLPYVLSVTPRPAELVREIRRICKPGGTIVVLNHFSGSRFWWLMERAFRSAAEHVGFRSDFRYEEQILSHDWEVVGIESVNLLGLSRLVVLNNRRS
ncbi:class I SAM-dependent methyltransferase [Variovorax sp. PBS-H4]|uniref:class I SAM-dependent methyltransferase n=1 Tax=Variovorax sp. PBS-H4 TaxID=434008 RepID=UPI0013A5B810|nr:class I SAM-dependent methyltransferase [Variovorax sp. PBS-H4]